VQVRQLGDVGGDAPGFVVGEEMRRRATVQLSAPSGGGRSRGQITRLGRQPFANDASAELAIVRPSLREAMVDDVVALDAERVLDDPGGAISVVAVIACARRFLIGVDDIRQRPVIDRDQRERFVGYRLAGRPNRFCTTASALVPTFIEA
jgi:hypothetical protein